MQEKDTTTNNKKRMKIGKAKKENFKNGKQSMFLGQSVVYICKEIYIWLHCSQIAHSHDQVLHLVNEHLRWPVEFIWCAHNGHFPIAVCFCVYLHHPPLFLAFTLSGLVLSLRPTPSSFLSIPPVAIQHSCVPDKPSGGLY